MLFLHGREAGARAAYEIFARFIFLRDLASVPDSPTWKKTEIVL